MVKRTPPGAFKALLVLLLSMSLAAVAFASPFCLCGGAALAKAAKAGETAMPSCHGSGAAPEPADRGDHTDHDGGAKPDGCKMACHMPAVLGNVERLAVRVPRLEPVAELVLLPAPLVAFEIDHIPLV